MAKFKKGDLLTTNNTADEKAVARVERVTRDGVVHCVNLVECPTMKKGETFAFTPDELTRYRPKSRR